MKGGIDASALGAVIRHRREARGLSQRAFSEQVNLSPQSMTNIESGKQVPTLETLDRIAKALDCPLCLLIAYASFGRRSSAKRVMEMLTVEGLLASLQLPERKLSIAVLRTLVEGLEESRRSRS